MKDLQEFIDHNKNIILKEYGVKMKKYLALDEVQNIVNTTVKFDSYAERKQNIDMLVLAYCTDIGIEKIQEMGYDYFLQSGLMDEVRIKCENYSDIFVGLEYTESTTRALAQIVKELPQTLAPLKDVIQKHDNHK